MVLEYIPEVKKIEKIQPAANRERQRGKEKNESKKTVLHEHRDSRRDGLFFMETHRERNVT